MKKIAYSRFYGYQLLTFCILLVISLNNQGHAQIGNWKAQTSFSSLSQIAGGGGMLNGVNLNGIFSLDPATGVFSSFSRVEGMSDSHVSAIGYSVKHKTLVVGYQNGNLDRLKSNVFRNLPDLKNKGSLIDKEIHSIFCQGDDAWLCCPFGLVRLNLNKWEIRSTIYFGTLDGNYSVNEMGADSKYYWVATRNGIYRTPVSNPSLEDQSGWEIQPLPIANYLSLAINNDQVLVCNSLGSIYLFDGQKWSQTYHQVAQPIRVKAGSSANSWFILSSDRIYRINGIISNEISNYGQTISPTGAIAPTDCWLDSSSNLLWITDAVFGLIKSSPTGSFEKMTLPGPGLNSIGCLTSLKGKVYASSGFLQNSITPKGEFDRYDRGVWVNVDQSSDNQLNNISAIGTLAGSFTDQTLLYASTSSQGLLLFRDDKLVKHYDSTNSSLETQNGICRVDGLASESDGSLWVTNSTSRYPLHLFSADGHWQAMDYKGDNSLFSGAGSLTVSNNNVKWITIGGQYLMALNTNNTPTSVTDDTYRKVTVKSRFVNQNGTFTKGFSQINCTIFDHNGDLWVGTESGVVCYNQPDQVFKVNDVYGTQPSVDQGDQYYHPLLDQVKISSIMVDGGNRKWIGTVSSGLYLFTADGTRLIHHFDHTNSPLFSDQILSLAFDDSSGEVFIATSEGMLSFISDATPAADDFSGSYVWPNPVRETYHGDVVIDRLTEGAIVKISDVAGNLVYQTTAVGGRATWDGKRHNGQRVSTGVYLIFCSNSDGSKSKVMKLLFIH